MRLLNCTVTGALVGTRDAPFGGLVSTTRGGVVSGTAPVVNVLWNGAAIRLPAPSRTP